VESYIAFSKGFGNDGNANVPMATLKRMCGEAFSQHYVLLLALVNVPKPLFDHFVVQLESFLFYYIYTKTPTRELERNFSQWADELREIADLKDGELQRAKMDEFIDNRFRASMVAKSDELSDALKRYTLQSMQQYRTRYLLAKLTQFVDMAYKGIKTPGPLNDYMTLEIEHILPNTPQAELRQSFHAGSPGSHYDEYKNKLGNFTLLEKPINIVASNGFFDAKKVEYKKCKCYLTSSIAELCVVGKDSSINRINEKLKAFDKWDATSIDQRQLMLIGLAKEVWKASLTDVIGPSGPSSPTDVSDPGDDEDDEDTTGNPGDEKRGRDYSKYDVVLNGVKQEALPKRKAIFAVVKHLCAQGVTPEEIAEMVPWRSTMFCSVDGTVSSQEFISQKKAKVDSGDKRRYFCDDGELIRSNGKTYALSNGWGNRTFQAIQRIIEKFPDKGACCEQHPKKASVAS
jgi:hypothetical protein